MHLVQIRECLVTLRDIAQLRQGRDVPLHRVHGLEADQLGAVRDERAQLAVEVGRVVMAEDVLLHPAPADPFDHGCVVLLVRQDGAAGQQLGHGADGRLVGDVPGAEQESRFLLVQVRQLPLQEHVEVVGPGDVAGTTRPRPDPSERLHHRPEDGRMLAHPEVVVRAPDGDVYRTLRPVPDRPRKPAALTLQVGKDPVAALGPGAGSTTP